MKNGILNQRIQIKINTKINTKLKRYLPYIFLILTLSVVLLLLGTKIKSEDIVTLVARAGVWGPLFYILILASTQIFAPISGTPVFLAGYVLFNSKVQLFAYLATLFSATVNFWLARRWGRKLVIKMVGEKDIDKIDAFTKDYGIQSLILLRLLQGHLADFIV